MTGIELVAGYLAAWAARRGLHAAGRLGSETDQALDHALDQLHDRVYARLGNRSVLKRLETDAQRGVTDPAVHGDVQFMVGSAAAADPALARELGRLVGQLEQLRPNVTLTSTTADRGGAIAGTRSRQATGAHSQVGHRINIGSFGAGGAVLVVLIVAVVLVYFLKTNAPESSETKAYRTQAVAACHQVANIVGENYNAALLNGTLDTSSSSGGFNDLLRVDKAALVAEMNDRVRRVDTALGVFFRAPPPKSLAATRSAAMDQANTWARARAANVRLIQKHIRDGSTSAQIKADTAGVNWKDEDEDLGNLGASLGTLSGQSCSLVNNSPVPTS